MWTRTVVAMTQRPRSPERGRPGWWAPGMPARAVMLALAATPAPLPAVTAARLAGGAAPAALLRPDSPDPGAVATRLEAIGARLLLPGPAASVAVVGGRRASPLRRAAARALGAGLAAAGWSVVSGGAVGVDAAAHGGALDGGGRTVVVLGCGLDVAYPRANAGLFARVLAAGGSVVSEHPPGVPPRPAHFLPRNRLIAALAAAVVVVEAAEDSGSLSTAKAAGGRGSGRVLVVPGAPWDAGAAGCNALIRDGATLVRGLADILEELGASAVSVPGSSAVADEPAGTPSSARTGMQARKVLAALVDGGVLGAPRLAALTGLEPTALAAALLELELAGLVRRTAAGVQAVALPGSSRPNGA